MGAAHSFMGRIPKEVQKLLEQRNEFRRKKKYAESDAIRKKLEQMGYEVLDKEEGTEVLKKDTHVAPKQSFLVLFGSGEIAPSGVGVHNYVLERIGRKKPAIAIISTPAGFQPNVQVVYEEIAE